MFQNLILSKILNFLDNGYKMYYLFLPNYIYLIRIGDHTKNHFPS